MAQQSVETLFNSNVRDVPSEISLVWSTEHVPGMDNAAGGRMGLHAGGRRRLRYGSLALGALLTMHCRVAASSLTGGTIMFVFLMITAVSFLANPLRHFEVYLGQWSISGPGRAFRVIPIFDGIGIAMCIIAIVRAITCCVLAAIAAMYVVHSVSDSQLPFTYCRDFNLQPYQPVTMEIVQLNTWKDMFSFRIAVPNGGDETKNSQITSVNIGHRARNNVTSLIGTKSPQRQHRNRRRNVKLVKMCREKYLGSYPTLYNTPAYNFFYVELVHFRTENSFMNFNIKLTVSIFIIWIIIWAVIIKERIYNGRLIWNNMYSWLAAVPSLWSILLIAIASLHFYAERKNILHKMLDFGTKEFIYGLGDALDTAVYIHSASTGTELIHGKGLNHYAAGHIDTNLHDENLWHSSFLLVLTAMQSIGISTCAVVDPVQPNNEDNTYEMFESTLWIMPMYSQCVLVTNHSHLLSALIFGGLMFSYTAVAFVMLKTALHTIFEYRVRLVFREQTVVAALMLSCMALSMLFVTNGGTALLTSVDSIMAGVAVPLVCSLELIGLLYMYRSRDFISDMNVATEDNTCASRISLQWQIIPFITIATLIIKVVVLTQTELPAISMYLGAVPVACVVAAVPLRAAHNSYVLFCNKKAQRNRA